MVCKEEVCAWFKDITGAERIELLCSLLHMCVPMELRFIGSCLEDLARKDFIYLRDAEIKANDIAEIKKLKHDFMDEGTRSRVSLYLALLYSTNNACSHTMFELLSRVEPSLRQQSAKCTNSVDTTLAEDAVLILAMAANHPAFTFSQRQQLYRDLKSVEKLQQNLSDSGKANSSSELHHGCPRHLEPCGLTGEDTCDVSQRLTAPHQHYNTGCGTNIDTSSQCRSWFSPVSSAASESLLCRQHNVTMTSTSEYAVYVKGLELKGSPQRHADRQHGFHIQVTWSNGEVTEATRTYEELHNFHAELIRLFPKDSGAHRQERHIPFLPQHKGSANSRKELTEQLRKYIRQLSSVPEHIIQCHHLTAFFRPPPLKPTVIISPSRLPLGGAILSSSSSNHSVASSRTGGAMPSIPLTSPSTLLMMMKLPIPAGVDEDNCSADSTSSSNSVLRSHGPSKGHAPITPARSASCHTIVSSPKAAVTASHSATTPVNYRYTNNARSATHSAGVTAITTAVTPMMLASPTTTSPLSSPCASPSSACNHGDCGGSGCSGSVTVSHNSNGQATLGDGEAVSINNWLKTIRLHKYTDCLGSYTFEQIVKLTDTELDEKGLTAGARRKFHTHVRSLRDYLSRQPPPNGIVLPGGNANSSSSVTAVSSCDVTLVPLLVATSDLSSVSSVDSSAASVCSEVASPRASPTAMLTPTDTTQKGPEPQTVAKGNTWPRSYSNHDLHQMGAMVPAMNTSTSDLTGGRRLAMSFISSRPASTPAPSYHMPLLVGPPPQVASNTFIHGTAVNARPDMPPVLPFPAGVRPLGPTAIETHPFCQPHIAPGMFPSSRMPPPPPHMLRSPRNPGQMSGYAPKTTALCGSTIVGGSTAWPSLTADVAKCKMISNVVLTGGGCTNTTDAVPTTMSVAMAPADGSKPRQPVIYHPTVNSHMIASNMPPPRPNSLQVAPTESGVAYELKGVPASSASEPSVGTSAPYVMYHTASSSCSNNTVVYSTPAGFNGAMSYPPIPLTPSQSPAPSGGSPGPTTLALPANSNNDNAVSPCPCSSCAKQAPAVTSSYQYSYPLMWPPHGAIYQAPAGAYHMGFMPPSTSNGLINPCMSYRQVHPSYNLPNGYSPEVLYANQANYASVLPPSGTGQGNGPQPPAFVNCVQYVAGGRSAMPAHQYMMASGASKANKKAVCCCNCGSAGHLSANCKETTMDCISHIACFHLKYNWVKSDSE